MRAIPVLLVVVVFIPWTKAQNPVLSLLDAFAKARNAIKLLELDSMYFNLPFGDRDVDRVTFTLFTFKNRFHGQMLVFNDSLSVAGSRFDGQIPTKILIHGYTQSSSSLDFPQSIISAYTKISKNETTRYNVICVDWSVLSKEILYTDSANYTNIAGQKIAEFIVFLKDKQFIQSYRDLHLIGFSLGAHVAGIVGDYISKLSGGNERIGRITGLDPAGPGFASVPRDERLDRDDAEFVDVIHTNMGSILLADLGSTMPHGDADFYPNGGRRQPGCEYSLFREYSIPRKSSCSHLKAAEYFKNSILTGNKYLATRCDSWATFQASACPNESETDTGDNSAVMGEKCSKEAKGKYFLSTTQ